MEKPTKENPRIDLGGAYVMRGYAVPDPKTEKFEFIGAHDGPLLEFRGPGGQHLIANVELVPQLILALELATQEPIASPGAHDKDLLELGFRPPTDEETSQEIARLAGQLMHHEDERVRRVAASALTQAG